MERCVAVRGEQVFLPINLQMGVPQRAFFFGLHPDAVRLSLDSPACFPTAMERTQRQLFANSCIEICKSSHASNGRPKCCANSFSFLG